MLDLKANIGKKVKLIRGDKDSREPSGYRNTACWIAGSPRVGSVGVLHYGPANSNPQFDHYHIVWNSPNLKAKAGYSYMVTEDTNNLLIIGV